MAGVVTSIRLRQLVMSPNRWQQQKEEETERRQRKRKERNNKKMRTRKSIVTERIHFSVCVRVSRARLTHGASPDPLY